MKARNQRKWAWFVEVLAPLVVFALLVYGSWVYAYYVCWGEVRQYHSKATATGLVVGEVLLIVMVYVSWAQIIMLGPGKQPKLPLYRLVEDTESVSDYKCIEPPSVFMCDDQGFPIWCSMCNSIKADRAHHSTRMGHCVPKFDHYCTWLGAVLGKKNYRLFIQYCFWFMLFFVYVGVSMAVYAPSIVKHTGTLNPNIIVCFILCLLWLLMLFALVGQHVYYLFKNECSIDDIEKKQNKRTGRLVDRYYSVTLQDARYVLRVNPYKENVYDAGIVENWVQAMGRNPLYWILPLGSPVERVGDDDADLWSEILQDYVEYPSAKWMDKALKRISSGDYIKKETLPREK